MATCLYLRKIFVELIDITTNEVELSFNEIMYKQIDGVAMGAQLDPDLANIFVGFYETNSLAKEINHICTIAMLTIHL